MNLMLCAINNDSNSSTNSINNGAKSSDRDLGFHFLDVVRRNSSSPASCSEGEGHVVGANKMDVDEVEEVPTELNTINSSGGFVVVSGDKLSVKYTSVNLHGHDVGVVQANKAAPVKRMAYYFEMSVKNAGVKGQVSIGFTCESFKMRRQPGWEANSCGYHGDDGHLYRGQGKEEEFGPTYTTNDTVGGGINYASQEIFFTKNGNLVGTVFKDMKCPLFPTVAVHSQNEELEINFGQRPFAFDIKEYEAQERRKQQMTVEHICLQPNVSHILVRTYLLHYGYEETLDAFDSASKSTVPPICVPQENGIDDQDMAYALNHRKMIRQLIRNGEIDSTLSRLKDLYPQIVQDDKSATCFLLYCQKFIELVRVGALEEAVRYGRNGFSKFFELAEFEDMIQDSVTLLAYEQPQKSPFGYLLDDSQRELVADAVNAMILSTNPNVKSIKDCLHSYLERLLMQLTACCLEKRSLSGNQGEAFGLHRVLNPN